MEAARCTDRPSMGYGTAFLITLTALASALGYLGLLTYVAGSVLTAIYGSYSRNPEFLKVYGSLAKWWYLSVFFGLITTPVALLIALLATFLPIVRRAKIIIWTIAVGGALGWLISQRPLAHGW